MKLAPVLCACGCGRTVVQPRGGGQRKRFFDAACRGRWHRGQRTDVTSPVRGKSDTEALSAAEHVALLRRHYDELDADVQARGAVVGGKLNPALLALQKTAEQLARLAPAEEPPVATSLLELVVGPPNVG